MWPVRSILIHSLPWDFFTWQIPCYVINNKIIASIHWLFAMSQILLLGFLHALFHSIRTRTLCGRYYLISPILYLRKLRLREIPQVYFTLLVCCRARIWKLCDSTSELLTLQCILLFSLYLIINKYIMKTHLFS